MFLSVEEDNKIISASLLLFEVCHISYRRLVVRTSPGDDDPVQEGTYRVSQEECARLREGVPYVKVYRYNPKHLCPKLNGYGDNGQGSLKL